MFKFNYNVFKSNCNSLSKQFNQVHSTCVVYHDICQQSVFKPLSNSTLEKDTCNGTDKHENFHCNSQTCSTDIDTKKKKNDECKTTSTNTSDHHHHHNHVHGLVYSKRVRSILLLNALLSSPNRIKEEKSKPNSDNLTNNSILLEKWNSYTQQIRNYAKKASSKDKKKNFKKVDYSDEEINTIIELRKFQNDLEETIKKLQNDLFLHVNIKIGSNIELLKIETESESFLLKDIASLSKKNNYFYIDCSALPDYMPFVLKAIKDSGMNVSLQQDNNTIYFQQRKSTKEHRETLAKNCKNLLQKTKDNLRNLQNSYLQTAKYKKDEKISEDAINNCCDYIRFEIQKTTDTCINICEQKIKQILE